MGTSNSFINDKVVWHRQ